MIAFSLGKTVVRNVGGGVRWGIASRDSRNCHVIHLSVKDMSISGSQTLVSQLKALM